MRTKLTTETVRGLAPGAVRYEAWDTEIPGFLVRVTPDGARTFAVVYRDGSGRKKRLTLGKLGAVTLAAARKAAEVELARVRLGEDPVAVKKERRAEVAAPTLAEFLAGDYRLAGGKPGPAYGEWLATHRKSGLKTVRDLRAIFAGHLDKPLDTWSPWLAEKWRAERMRRPSARTGRPVAAETVNRDLAPLRAALAKAHEWGVLKAHPLAGVKKVRETGGGRVRYLSGDEERRLREALEARAEEKAIRRASANRWRAERGREGKPAEVPDALRAMVLVTLNTGLRRGELYGLDWSDLELGGRTPGLTVRASASKGGKPRDVPLNPEAAAALRQWKSTSGGAEGPVFPGKAGGRMDNHDTAWARLCARARIRGLRWHDLRHSFASKLVQSGVGLEVVRELLGHSDFKLTLIYAHLRPDAKRSAVAQLAPPGPAAEGSAK
jgi:integrase